MIENAKLILGPPGCGKTHRLIDEIRDALAQGAHPSRIGVISFTRKAIEEMVSRACAEFNRTPKDFPYMRTSHSFGFRALGLQPSDIMNKDDYDNVGRLVGLTFEGNMSTDMDEGMPLVTIGGSGANYLQMLDRSRLRMVSLEQELNDVGDWNLFMAKLRQLSEQMEEYKATTNKYDYVDMIEKFVAVGETPSLDYLFIDEAQDFTPLQWEMAKKIAAASDQVIIAGDDDQAIHRWTGVDVKLFMDCASGIEVLNQSYRIPAAVHRLAMEISSRITDRHDKEFLPREEEGAVEWVYHLEDIPLHEGSWTIMARTNGYVQELAAQIKGMGFKYSIKGRSSVSEQLVANIYTWEDLCADKSVSVQRAKDFYAAVPKQGQNAVVKRGSAQLLEALDPDGEVNLQDLTVNFGLLVGADTGAYDVLRVSTAEREYIDALHRRGDDLLSQPRIKLSTIHAMKGGEDDNCVVFLASTKAATTSRYQDDEHRAFYVAVTRAREKLYILQTNNKYRYTI